MLTNRMANQCQGKEYFTACSRHSILVLGLYSLQLNVQEIYTNLSYCDCTRRQLKHTTDQLCHCGQREHGVLLVFLLMNLRKLVITQNTICLIFYRAKGIIVTIRHSKVPWKSVYCIFHIACNFHLFQIVEWRKKSSTWVIATVTARFLVVLETVVLKCRIFVIKSVNIIY